MTTLSVAQTATLVHGYTMDDVEKLVRGAVNMYHRKRGMGVNDPSSQREDAWFGVIERLYNQELPPATSWDLLNAGFAAVEYENGAYHHHHGWNRRQSAAGTRYSMYWRAASGTHSDFADGLCERMSLPQLLALLTPKQYEAIVALAVHGNQVRAAQAIGLSKMTFSDRIIRAREVIATAWLAPDHPVIKRNGNDAVCRHGHDRTKHGGRNDKGVLFCRICDRNRQTRNTRQREGWRKPVELELEAEPEALAEAN